MSQKTLFDLSLHDREGGSPVHKKEWKVKNLTVLALCLVLPLAVGSQKKAEVEPGEATASTTESEVPGVTSTSDLSPATAQARIDDVTIGKSVAADGTIAADQQGDDFAPGDPVHIVVGVGDTPAGSAVKVVWFAADETRLGEETKTVVAGEKNLSFTSGDTSAWKEGDYRAEVWLADEKVNTQQFQIVPPANAGK
jgi:hypothetical protein